MVIICFVCVRILLESIGVYMFASACLHADFFFFFAVRQRPILFYNYTRVLFVLSAGDTHTRFTYFLLIFHLVFSVCPCCHCCSWANANETPRPSISLFIFGSCCRCVALAPTKRNFHHPPHPQVLMLEFWKRKEAELAMRWGMSDFESVRASAWSSVFGYAQGGAITRCLYLVSCYF